MVDQRGDPRRHGHGLIGSSVDKRGVRFTVEVDDAQLWMRWAPRQGMTRAHMKRLATTGGGGERTWYVVQRPIPLAEWLEVRNLTSDEVLLDAEALRRAERPSSPFER